MKLLKVEGARAPVPHSWRRHCPSVNCFPAYPSSPVSQDAIKGCQTEC